MYAKVIVDIPAKQTDRPFDYIIPPHLEAWVHVGSRVAVSFGARALQGFVVECSASSSLEQHKLKPLQEVLDLSPPLTPELMTLAHWMSRYYACKKISALQAMIPGALKAKQEKRIELHEHYALQDVTKQDLTLNDVADLDAADQQLIQYIRSKNSVEIGMLFSVFPTYQSSIKRLLGLGILQEVSYIKDRVNRKMVQTVSPAVNRDQLSEALESLPAKAAKQKQVLQHFLKHPEPMPMRMLLSELQIGSASIKSLADKGLLHIKSQEMYRDPYANRHFETSEPMALTDKQQAVIDTVQPDIDEHRYGAYLLCGVTGSGKTEVYLQLIASCIRQGREAIVLVPEISLTPQMVERFKGRFGDQVAVLHSRLSQGERYDEWRKIQSKQVKVAIGARSAIFAPFTKLGLIIIDEEHETSYKQEETPKYHAREVAMERGRLNKAVVVFGTATPSLESFFATTKLETSPMRRMQLIQMKERVQGRPLPQVQIIDMRNELQTGNRSMFSRALHTAIEERLMKQEQMVLLLNRRGYSTFVMCRACGYTAQCPHCDISLTYHRHTGVVRCHYCGHTEKEPRVCPECDSEHIRHFGTGTQKVEEELVRHFPGIRVIRMDVDTTTEKGSHEKWLTRFKERKADVLLGTQMVAKGLDFPHVTLVGVIAADTILNLPDFRAGEKTFQLLTQVAGRAGRHDLPGEVFIQTYTPEHYSIEAAKHHDFEGFVRQELQLRNVRLYPPFCKLILITLSHTELPLIVKTAERLAAIIKAKAPEVSQGQGWMEVLGPVASPIPRIKDRYRFQCVVKYRGEAPVVDFVRSAVDQLDDSEDMGQVQTVIDVDPQMLL